MIAASDEPYAAFGWSKLLQNQRGLAWQLDHYVNSLRCEHHHSSPAWTSSKIWDKLSELKRTSLIEQNRITVVGMVQIWPSIEPAVVQEKEGRMSNIALALRKVARHSWESSHSSPMWFWTEGGHMNMVWRVLSMHTKDWLTASFRKRRVQVICGELFVPHVRWSMLYRRQIYHNFRVAFEFFDKYLLHTVAKVLVHVSSCWRCPQHHPMLTRVSQSLNTPALVMIWNNPTLRAFALCGKFFKRLTITLILDHQSNHSKLHRTLLTSNSLSLTFLSNFQFQRYDSPSFIPSFYDDTVTCNGIPRA